jgi:predicted HTH transcriptional regulator
MSIDRSDEYIVSLIAELLKHPNETEWLEFKHNNDNPQIIGEYISALSNSAALNGKTNAYMIWGVNDVTHEILGTTFQPSKAKKGNEALENWLLRLLEPKIDFKFYEVTMDEKFLVLLEISPAYRHPVKFAGTEYIRISSHKKILKELPEKERELWRIFDQTPFEREIAAENIPAEKLLMLLDYPACFDLLSQE